MYLVNYFYLLILPRAITWVMNETKKKIKIRSLSISSA